MRGAFVANRRAETLSIRCANATHQETRLLRDVASCSKPAALARCPVMFKGVGTHDRHHFRGCRSVWRAIPELLPPLTAARGQQYGRRKTGLKLSGHYPVLDRSR